MGIKGAHSYTYSIQGLSTDQIFFIASERMRAKRNDNERTQCVSRLPCIDFDVSWIVRGFAKGTSESRINTLLRIASAFSIKGFHVKLVCDGVMRHHSKRATIHRQATTQKNKLDLIINKSQLMLLSQRRITTDSIEERKEIQETEKKLQSKILRLENEIRNATFNIGEAFVSDLEEALIRLDNPKITMCVALFQADSVMASRIVSKQSDILLTCDSDQAALLGADCVCIKSMKVKEEKDKTTNIENIDIFFADKSTLERTLQILNIPSESNNIVKATYPIFTGMENPRLRALVAVALGCDVFLNPPLTPSPLLAFVRSQAVQDVDPNDAYLAIKKYITSCWMRDKQKKKTVRKNQKNDIMSQIEIDRTEYNKMIDVFVDTFLFEPSNIMENGDITAFSDKHTYIHHPPPSKLHPYIQAFDTEVTDLTPVVDCSLDLPYCVGHGMGKHQFMRAEGHCFCSTCNGNICLQCTFQKGVGESLFCYQCYLPEISVQHDEVENNMSYDELRENLRLMGVETNATDNMCDLLEIYENEKTNQLYDQMILDDIVVPREKQSYLTTLQEEENKISSFEFTSGGQFIVDEKLDSLQVVKLIKIIAALVDITKPEGDTNGNKKYNDRTYRLLPQMIVTFAEEARYHEGFRLVKRCMMHALDPETESIVAASGQVVLYQEKPCFLIHHRIHASMKDDCYDVVVCFNAEMIVACSCGCKAGGETRDRIMCVHILPIIYQMCMLCFDGWADNIVVELSHHWSTIKATLSLSESELLEVKKIYV
jgi:hypothetical protein